MLRCVPYKSNFLKLMGGSDVSDLSLVTYAFTLKLKNRFPILND